MNRLKTKVISALSAAACLSAAYIVLWQEEPSILNWLLGVPAALIVAITALVRANDIPHEVTSWRGHLRRAGFVLAGVGSINWLVMPFGDRGHWPQWYSLLLLWGMAASWLTTPGMPPWWGYVTGTKKIRLTTRKP